MLPLRTFRRRVSAPGGLAGFAAPQTVVASAVSAGTYTGTVTGVPAGALVVFFAGVYCTTGGGNPASFTLAFDGQTLTPTAASGSTASTMPISAVFERVVAGGGDMAVTLTTGVTGARSVCIHAYVITGQHATPVVARGAPQFVSSTATAFGTPSGQVTTYPQSVVIGSVFVKLGTVTGLTSNADQFVTGTINPGASSGMVWGAAHKAMPAPGSAQIQWTWTTATQVAGAFAELRAA